MAAWDPELLEWARSSIGTGARIETVTGLRSGGAPWAIRLVRSGEVVDVVLRVGDADDPDAMRVEADGLLTAGGNGIPVPEVLAIRLEPVPLLLISRVRGSSDIPTDRPTQRLEKLGALAARISRVTPHDDAPRRLRTIAGVDFAALRRAAPPQDLLERGERAVADFAPDPAADGFVHGDLWQGNVMWEDERITAAIDWDCAGRGPAGVDLGSLRLDAALCFGADSAADVLRGWEDEAGAPAAALAEWDVVAALASPPDLGWFTDTIRAQGRPDLNAELLIARRDGFLADALDRLNG